MIMNDEFRIISPHYVVQTLTALQSNPQDNIRTRNIRNGLQGC
jgi:hypothetical protein